LPALSAILKLPRPARGKGSGCASWFSQPPILKEAKAEGAKLELPIKQQRSFHVATCFTDPWRKQAVA
jgi:hypothetical protein